MFAAPLNIGLLPEGVKWADKETWGCNAGLEADEGQNFYDGISLNPLEVRTQPVCKQTTLLFQTSQSLAKSKVSFIAYSSASRAPGCVCGSGRHGTAEELQHGKDSQEVRQMEGCSGELFQAHLAGSMQNFS